LRTRGLAGGFEDGEGTGRVRRLEPLTSETGKSPTNRSWYPRASNSLRGLLQRLDQPAEVRVTVLSVLPFGVRLADVTWPARNGSACRPPV
jgi:hypothetical protein